MKNKVIWYMSHHASGPGMSGAYRAYELTKRWKESGHTPIVFFASYSHLHDDKHYPKEQVIDGVKYVAIRTNKYSSNGIMRILSMFVFAWNCYFVGRKLPASQRKPDAIIASSAPPFVIFPARHLAKKHNARLVFEIRDLWPLSLTKLLNKSEKHPFVRLCAWTEKYAAKHADIISSALPNVAQYFKDYEIRIKDFLWVPNGKSYLEPKALADVGTDYAETLKFIENARKEKRTLIVYAGAMGPPNAVRRIIESFEYGQSSEAANTLAFLALGDGERRAQHEIDLAALPEIPSHFPGMVPKDVAQTLIGLCDIGYVGGTVNRALYDYGIAPNKIASYLDAGVMVLLPIPPCGDPISQSGAGITQELGTPEELWNAILDLAKTPEAMRAHMVAKGQAYLETTYNYDIIAQNYLDALFPIQS